MIFPKSRGTAYTKKTREWWVEPMMLAVLSGQIRAAASGILEAASARPEARRSVAAAIGHGVVIGAAATILELLLLVMLLYLCGVVAF